MKPILTLVLLVALLALPATTRAQDPTPAIVPACDVIPLPQERIDELAAIAAATPVPGLPTQAATLPAGAPVTADVQAQLADTLRLIEVCTQAGDLPRLLSLYTERFIVAQFFAPETVPIVPAPETTPIDATPASAPVDMRPQIVAAVQTPDGRVAALVGRAGSDADRQIVWFVQQDGRWLVDLTTPAADGAAGGPTGVEVPMEARAVIETLRQDAAAHLGVAPDAIVVTAIESVDWPDSSLGCAEEGGVYAPVISPGYRIIVTDGVTTLEYHTGPNDVIVRCTG